MANLTLMTFSVSKKEIKDFFRAESTVSALRVVIGVFTPVLLLFYFKENQLAIQVLLGGSFISAVDLNTNFVSKLKIYLTAFILTLILHSSVILLADSTVLLNIFLAIVIFLLAYIAAFDFNMAMLAFSGYLSIMLGLSFSARIEVDALRGHLSGVLTGELLYVAYSMIVFYLYKPVLINRKISDLLNLTADYFDLRLKYLTTDSFKEEEVLYNLAQFQTALNPKYDEIRDLILKERMDLLGSKRKNELYLFIFIELIEMFELALVTHFNPQTYQEIKKKYPGTVSIEDTIAQLPGILRELSQYVSQKKGKVVSTPDVFEKLNYLDKIVSELKQNKNPSKEEVKDFRIINRFNIYLKHQINKIERLIFLTSGRDNLVKMDFDASRKHNFIPARKLTKDAFISNLTLDSSYFRFAIRMAITSVTGYILAGFLHFQNPNWVLLTILVIMKPGYSITKNRFSQRIYGTIAGALIVLPLAYLNISPLLGIFLMAIAFFFAFSFLPKDYVKATLFFTLFVLLLFGVLVRLNTQIILFRVIDTIFGGILCYIAIRTIFPFWEQKSIPVFINEAWSSNKQLALYVLEAIKTGKIDKTTYRSYRKDSYVKMANLISSYNRLMTDPKEKQKLEKNSYNIIMNNYSFMITTSSIGVYMTQFEQKVYDLDLVSPHADKLIEELNYTKEIKILTAEKNIQTSVPETNIEPDSLAPEVLHTRFLIDQIERLSILNESIKSSFIS
ncbi:FUSC family protein [Marinigracilibium pacificum]|uniref:Membrane protein YccC n=1 Tax=Marinigracilibium pacificum TaxID=2729599 RepID=A0A848IY63_9BACT|nr:FUSC family protein [Marinigracilibium pacificum]NMM48225.1 hypothetical protein [Marinigracilibium pacificum]